MRFLLVDDAAVSLFLLRSSLKGVVWIDEAFDSHRAWELLQKSNYDLLIVDHLMKNGTGLELAQRCRAEGLDLPILMISGVHAEEAQVLRQALSQLSNTAFLPKPFDIDEFCRMVKRLTGVAIQPTTWSMGR